MNLDHKPLRITLIAIAAIHVLSFFLVPYAKVNTAGQVVGFLQGFLEELTGSGEMSTLLPEKLTAIKAMQFSGLVTGDTVLYTVVFTAPVLLAAAILIINLINLRANKNICYVISLGLSAIEALVYVFIQVKLISGFVVELAYDSTIYAYILALLCAAQCVICFLCLQSGKASASAAPSGPSPVGVPGGQKQAAAPHSAQGRPAPARVPVTPQRPAPAQPPVAPQRPASAQPPVAPQRPASAQAPAAPQRPASYQPPVAPQRPASSQPPVAPQRPAPVRASAAPQRPAQSVPPVQPQPAPNRVLSPANTPTVPISTADSLGGRIIGVSGDTYAGAVLPLGDGESVIIGRDPQNSSIILSDPKISRVHCRITYRAAQRAYQVKDFSTNGTFVYGDENWRLPQKKDIMLTPGTVLQIGDSDFRFRLG